MDTDGVERVDSTHLGGADVVTVNNLTGTDVTEVNIDLAAALGGAAGDGTADRVIVNATKGNDKINVSGDAAGVNVTGLAATVGVRPRGVRQRQPRDQHGRRHGQHQTAGLAAGLIQLFVDGVLVP